MAHARMADPWTSHEAAASVTNISATQAIILGLLTIPQTDEQLVEHYMQFRREHPEIVPKASASGIRSRRAELFQVEKVVPVGYARTESGRKAIVWEAA